MSSKSDCENWVVYSKKTPTIKMVWREKIPVFNLFQHTLPFDVWMVIMSYASKITRIKMSATCKKLHKKMGKSLEDFYDDLSDDNVDFKSTIMTHLITNIPLEKCRNLTIHMWDSNKIMCYIDVSDLKYEMLPDDFYCYVLPETTYQSVFLGPKRMATASVPDLVVDSEKLWGRPKIIESLPFKPIHCSHASGWNYLSDCPGNTECFTVIICTDKLIFKK
jgi:hypothetical protein